MVKWLSISIKLRNICATVPKIAFGIVVAVFFAGAISVLLFWSVGQVLLT